MPIGIARRAATALLALALVLGPPLGSAARAEGRVVVFAAASLMGALGEVARGWEADTGADVTLSHAGSAALARQIERGAPADVFVSANAAWMNALEAEGLIRPGSRRDLLSNRLVLIAHGRAEPVALAPGLDLAGVLGEDGRLAMALVDAVPAGIYGRATLASLGAWEAVAPRVVQADSVRAALALVARGEAPYGVVYATDAMAEPRVSVVGTFPEGSHPPIVYPAALTAEAGPEAAAFLDHLASPEARAVFERHGFVLP